MAVGLGEQAAQVIVRAGTEFTTEVIRGIIEKLLSENKNKNLLQHGQDSNKDFSKYGQQLVKVEIEGVDLKEFKRQLKKHGVDFAVMKENKESGNYSVFFKAKDSVSIYAGLEKVLQDVIKRQEKTVEKKPLKETVKQAQQQAEEHNQQQTPDKNKLQDRGDR